MAENIPESSRTPDLTWRLLRWTETEFLIEILTMASRPFTKQRPRFWQGQNEEKKKNTNYKYRQPVKVVNPPPEAAKNESSKEKNEKMKKTTNDKEKGQPEKVVKNIPTKIIKVGPSNVILKFVTDYNGEKELIKLDNDDELNLTLSGVKSPKIYKIKDVKEYFIVGDEVKMDAKKKKGVWHVQKLGWIDELKHHESTNFPTIAEEEQDNGQDAQINNPMPNKFKPNCCEETKDCVKFTPSELEEYTERVSEMAFKLVLEHGPHHDTIVKEVWADIFALLRNYIQVKCDEDNNFSILPRK